MSLSHETASHGRPVRRPTLVAVLLVIAIVAILVALIVPSVEWASSGSARFPVRVIVFDAQQSRPIANAHVAIFRASPLSGLNTLEENRGCFDPENGASVSDISDGVTGADGTAVVEYEFRTGASQRRPTPFICAGSGSWFGLKEMAQWSCPSGTSLSRSQRCESKRSWSCRSACFQ